MNKLFGLSVLWLLMQPLSAETWAILPFQVNASPGTIQPAIADKSVNLGHDLAKAARTYLHIRGIKNLVSHQATVGGLEKLQLNKSSSLNPSEMLELGKFLRTDYLVETEVNYSKDKFHIQSKIFYVASAALTNPIKSSEYTILKSISDHFDMRFNLPEMQLKESKAQQNPLIFVLDASGKNTSEIREITESLKYYDPYASAACVLDGNGTLSTIRFGDHAQKTIPMLTQIRPSGGGKYARNSAKLWDCAKRLSRETKKTELIVLVGSMPVPGSRDFYRVQSHLRYLFENNRTIVLLSAAISTESRKFWKKSAGTASRLSGSYVEDIQYRLQAGLSNGTSLYIFQKSDQISAAMQANPNTALNWQKIPQRFQANFRRSSIPKVYETVSGNSIITEYKSQGMFTYHLDNFFQVPVSSSQSRVKSRMLITVPAGSFWFSFSPGKYAETSANGSIHFLTQLEPASQGMPIQNNPHHTMFIPDETEIPAILKIDIQEYLLNPENYMGKSLAASSIYLITGKVEE